MELGMRKESRVVSHFHTSETYRTKGEKGKKGSCGQRWTFVAHPPQTPEVHFFVDQLFKTK